MSLFEKIKLLETKKDNPDQLSLDLDGANDKRSKAQKFTDKINKANKNRPEGKRPYFRGRKAERKPNASGVKPTGSFSRGTLKSSPTGQRAYDYEKLGIDARERKARADKLDRKLNKSFMKGGKYPEGLQKALDKDNVKTPSQGIEKAAKDVVNRMKAGDKKARKQIMDLVDKDFKSKTPAKQKEYIDKFDKIQRAKGRTFNMKTGNYDPSPFEQQGKKSRRQFPGDKSGKYQAAKSDLEARKGFKSKPGGLKADERNPFVKREVRKGRVKDLGGDIYDQPKFSQKKFDKSIGGAKKPTDPAAPGLFGKSDTKPKSFKKFTKDAGSFDAKKQAIKDIRASEKRLYDAGVGKKPSLAQQRKFAKDAFKKAQAKQAADFNKQQRLKSLYSPFDDGDLGNPEFAKKTPKKVKFSSGAKGTFVSGSPEMGGESKKFANRNRTPAPQPYRNKGVGIEKTGETKVDKAQRKAISKTSKQIKDIKGKLLKQRENVRSLPGDELGRKNTKLLRKINRGIKGIESQEAGYKKAAKGSGNPNAPTVYNKKFADLQKDLTKKGKITQIKPEKTDKVIDLFGKSKSGNYRSGSQSIYPNRLTNQGSKVTGTDLFRQNTIKGTSKVTGSKTGSEIFKQNIIKGAKGPTSMKNVKLLNKPFMKKMMKNTAKAAIKSGPVGRGIAGAALVAGGLYFADKLRKQFAGGGKTKEVPAVKGSPLRYKQGVKDDQGRDIGGQKKYFKLKDIKKTPYFTPSDLKDATFDNKADKNLQKRVRDSLKK